MYTLLRNHLQPSEEQLMEALGGRSDMEKTHHLPEARWETCPRLFQPSHKSSQPCSGNPLVVSKVATTHPGAGKNGRALVGEACMEHTVCGSHTHIDTSVLYPVTYLSAFIRAVKRKYHQLGALKQQEFILSKF